MVQRTNKHVKLIYIKFGELVLKGKNRWDFTNCLLKNIKTSLQTFKKLETVIWEVINLSPIVEYEIFDPISKMQLNLTYCHGITIEIQVPVIINLIELLNPIIKVIIESLW